MASAKRATSDNRQSNKRKQIAARPDIGAHLCTPQQFVRYARPDAQGLSLYGTFWGHERQCLSQDKLCLSAEDAARGIVAFGVPGAGKTQSVILPLIADHMQAGHSVIVVDPQGELAPYVAQFAAVTGHTVAIHDPAQPDSMRFNLADQVITVSDARAIAGVLIPMMPGDNRFWSEAAIAFLAAGLLRYNSLGEVFTAMGDLPNFAKSIQKTTDDAALLAGSFLSGYQHNDWRLLSNIVATVAASINGWAAQTVRDNTAVSDFDTTLLTQQPTVVVLTCPGRMRDTFAPYLGAVLCKLILDLDTIGQQQADGRLPLPVALVMDEFPTLGRLDSLVSNINLTRKRRISIILAAQTKSQLHRLYGEAGTDILLAGLATQIVCGGGDVATAMHYSQASGWQINSDGSASYALLTANTILSPAIGNCTIFTRFVDAEQAAQVVMLARLTRFVERADWQQRLAACQDKTPRLMKRRVTEAVAVKPMSAPVQFAKPTLTVPLDVSRDTARLERMAAHLDALQKLKDKP